VNLGGIEMEIDMYELIPLLIKFLYVKWNLVMSLESFFRLPKS
jgi:hypothetical protein